MFEARESVYVIINNPHKIEKKEIN